MQNERPPICLTLLGKPKRPALIDDRLKAIAHRMELVRLYLSPKKPH